MDKTEFDEHALWAAINDTPDSVEDISPGLRAYGLAFKDSIHKTIVIPQQLQALDQQWRTLNANSNNWQSYLLPVLNSLAMLPTSNLKGGAARQASAIVAETITTANNQVGVLKDTVAELVAELAELRTAIEQNSAAVQNVATEVQTQTAAQEDLFTNSQAERGEKFQEWWDKVPSEMAKDGSEKISALTEKAKKELQTLQDVASETKTLATNTTGGVMGRAFQKDAGRERMVSYIAFSVGVAVLVLAGVFLHNLAGEVNPDTKVTWQWTTLRVALVLVGVTAATASFKLGSSARRSAEVNQRIALEFSALPPFIASIANEDAREDVLATFADRTFGRGSQSESDEGDGTRDQSALDRLRARRNANAPS